MMSSEMLAIFASKFKTKGTCGHCNLFKIRISRCALSIFLHCRNAFFFLFHQLHLMAKVNHRHCLWRECITRGQPASHHLVIGAGP